MSDGVVRWHDLRQNSLGVGGHLAQYIGLGIQIPQVFVGGSTAVNDMLSRINQSIYMILSTRKGERVFRPDFGSNLYEIVFDPIDEASAVSLRIEVADAIKKWEPRVQILQIIISKTPDMIDRGVMGISIVYQVIGTSVVGNFVYPYYLGGNPFR